MDLLPLKMASNYHYFCRFESRKDVYIQIYDQFDCQKLNIKCCKFILGVLGELGHFPLFIDIIINLFKYYKRINDMEQDSLLNQALNECKTFHQSGKISRMNKCLI
jgi:hypothetical protein